MSLVGNIESDTGGSDGAFEDICWLLFMRSAPDVRPNTFNNSSPFPIMAPIASAPMISKSISMHNEFSRLGEIICAMRDLLGRFAPCS
jgi:hypothetical protein